MPNWAWLLLAVAGLLLFVILEGKRQERKYGRSGRGATLMRTGMLELQRHLQPERKVEIFLERKERAAQVESGDKPDAGKSPAARPSDESG